MPALVHFAPTLTQGNLVIGPSSVNTQINGLVEVSVEYICRASDLEAQVEKFYVDAPPPVFPTRGISPNNLQQGKLFMVNYGVTEQYGLATISAQYAGVTSKAARPFKTFDYTDFSIAAPVYVSLSGNFGSTSYIGENNTGYNHFSTAAAMTVGMKGRLEAMTLTWATLDASGELPSDAMYGTNDRSALVELELTNQINATSDSGVFGFVERQALENGQLITTSTPQSFTSDQVVQYAADQYEPNGSGSVFSFFKLTLDDWLARGVEPTLGVITSRKIQAITPSVFVCEVYYTPRAKA